MPGETTIKKQYVNDLKGLDILRFILSLSVIIWHYQHFFTPFLKETERVIYLDRQPFYNALKLFYTEGYYAVQVFWLISGIIFYKMYQEKVLNKTVNFKSFMMNRFSRLYPLHLLTLLLVLVLQKWLLYTQHSYFVYADNSMKSFVQHLLFVQTWGANKFSFNGPTWSVSIEILAYLIFFVVCVAGFISGFRNLLLTILFFVMIKKWQLVFLNDDIASCIYFFFFGCLFIKIFDAIKEKKTWLYGLWGALLLFWLFTIKTPVFLQSAYSKASGWLDLDLLSFSAFIVLSFLLFFNLKWFDRVNAKYFRFIGDMTYSSYLIHFPLQILIFLIVKPASYEVFFSVKLFLVYIGSIIVLGRLVYRYFELPVQNLIRKKYMTR